MKKIIFLYLFLVLAVIALAVVKFTGIVSLFPGNSKSKPEAIINSAVFKIEIAKEAAAKEKGLSKRKSLDKDSGLLFIFDQKAKHQFWMKDMLFPIDIIYIAKTSTDSITTGTIVDIVENAKIPAKDTPPSSLEIYQPQKDADLVLEINAGLAKEKGIKIGDTVTLKEVK